MYCTNQYGVASELSLPEPLVQHMVDLIRSFRFRQAAVPFARLSTMIPTKAVLSTSSPHPVCMPSLDRKIEERTACIKTVPGTIPLNFSLN